MDTYFICDRTACAECNGECMHTSNIAHAAHFKAETSNGQAYFKELTGNKIKHHRRQDMADKTSMHKSLCDGLNATYIRKNADYGDSFGESVRDLGIVAAVVRIGDKYNRIKSLAKKTADEIKVKGESVRDTLLDMANYCVMTVVEMDDASTPAHADAAPAAVISTAERTGLASYSWVEIAALAQTDAASQIFKVGDKKEITLKTGEVVELVVVENKPKDMLACGRSAGLVFGIASMLDGDFEMNKKDTNEGGWEASRMRNVYMERFFALLPDELQAVIQPAKKKTGGGSPEHNLVETVDKLFLFSESEVFGAAEYSVAGEGEQYAYFKKAANRKKHHGGDMHGYWWLRSPSTASATDFRYVYGGGSVGSYDAGYTVGVAFGFCL